MLTPRERVLCALNHEEPDRVPIFFGTSGVTTMLAAAYDRLKSYLGVYSETKVFWRALQYTLLDEAVMVRFGSDGRPLIPGPAPSTLEREISADSYVDQWGITWRRPPGHYYYNIVKPPLQAATRTYFEAQGMTWPCRTCGSKSPLEGARQPSSCMTRLRQESCTISYRWSWI